jgi:disease resistance protein RPS2
LVVIIFYFKFINNNINFYFKRLKGLASSSNVNDNAISSTPQEQNNNEVDNLAGDAGKTQAPDIMEDDTENGTGGVVQPGAGANSIVPKTN